MVVKVASANDKISTKIHILCFSYFKNYKQQSANTNVFSSTITCTIHTQINATKSMMTTVV